MNTDLIILGGGPAGLTAGMYASRARIPLLLIEKGLPGGQMASTEIVENYPGFAEPIYGADLAQKMEAHARKFGLEIIQADIQSVEPDEQGFTLKTEAGETYSCKALIVATGASPVKLGIPGEAALAGKGVSYCAVCDGPFFRDFEVAVVGGGDSAVQESLYLTRFARKVHLIHRRDALRALRDLQERAINDPNITIHWNRVPVEVLGDQEVEGLTIRSVQDGSEERLPVGGVFFYVGLKPSTEVLEGLVETDDAGFVITDERMATSRQGILAAGDVRSKQLRQISTAVGDGAAAAYSAQHYLESL